MRLLLAFLFFTIACPAQPLPDTPTPKLLYSESTPTLHYEPVPPVRVFWTRSTQIAAVSTIGLMAADSAQTCYRMANVPGWHEHFGPNNCAGDTAEMVIARIALWSAAYIAHRHGHDRIAIVLEWAGPVSNVAGIGYSQLNTHGPGPTPIQPTLPDPSPHHVTPCHVAGVVCGKGN